MDNKSLIITMSWISVNFIKTIKKSIKKYMKNLWIIFFLDDANILNYKFSTILNNILFFVCQKYLP